MPKLAREFCIATYDMEDGWRLQITCTEDNYEAWIYHQTVAYKELMFGMPKEQQDYEEFKEISLYNFEEYQNYYAEDYEVEI